MSLTNVVLAPSSKEGGSLWIKKDNEEYLIASLTKERPQATINLFISLVDELTLLVKGNATLHVVGFYEPDQDADLPFGEEDLEDEEDEEDEEEEVEEKSKETKEAAKPVPAQKKPEEVKPKAQ